MYFILFSFLKILSCTFQSPLQDNPVYVQSDGYLTERDRIKVEESAWMLLQLQTLATRGQYLPWRINDRLWQESWIYYEPWLIFNYSINIFSEVQKDNLSYKSHIKKSNLLRNNIIISWLWWILDCHLAINITKNKTNYCMWFDVWYDFF